MNDETGQDPAAAARGDAAPEGAAPPTDEELRAAFEEQMRQIRVEDVLLQTAATLVNLAARRLGMATEPGEDPSAERDLDQAKLAIEGVRALIPICPPEHAEPIRQALTQIQMVFAREAGTGAVPSRSAGDPGQPAQGGGEAQPGDPGQPQAPRDDVRSRIWTPPGS